MPAAHRAARRARRQRAGRAARARSADAQRRRAGARPSCGQLRRHAAAGARRSSRCCWATWHGATKPRRGRRHQRRWQRAGLVSRTRHASARRAGGLAEPPAEGGLAEPPAEERAAPSRRRTRPRRDAERRSREARRAGEAPRAAAARRSAPADADVVLDRARASASRSLVVVLRDLDAGRGSRSSRCCSRRSSRSRS